MGRTYTKGNLTIVDNRGSTVTAANPDTSSTPDTDRDSGIELGPQDGAVTGGKSGALPDKSGPGERAAESLADSALAGPRMLAALGKPGTWLRIGEGILGVLALIGGVVLLAKATGFTKPAEQAVGAIVGVVGPGGKIGKAVQAVQAVKGGAS